jgi:DNA modification methylase
MKSIESGAAAASPPRPWPADWVEQWPIERLIPYANNPRLHSAADIERIAASILKWGWTNPVLVDEHGVLIAGHGRVAAVGNRQREPSWGHATQKPVECMRRPIVNNSRLGELVYDPFLGSGTSLIAAEMTGRTCCGLEISPAYVDVILRRWQAFTGRSALHQASGQSFAERCQDPDASGSTHG